MDLTTGYDKVLDENIDNFYFETLTDRCALWLRDDLSGENAYILHCYDYLTGETREYPLHGDKWNSHGIYYDRGQLYFAHASRKTGGKFSTVNRDLVVWDITSGAWREIYGGVIEKEVRE